MTAALQLRQRLDSPLLFTLSTPLLSLLGAATTIIAPMILDPSSFASFVLLLSIFQYVGDFDLGLSRLSDRLLTQGEPNQQVAIAELLSARLIVGLLLVVAAIVCFCVSYPLVGISILGGVGVMLLNGVLAIYRATSQMARFTIAASASQFGMSLPRLIGLLFGGVEGCLIAVSIWYVGGAFVLYAPYIRVVHRLTPGAFSAVLRKALPLFVLSSSWLVYVLASRWFGWVISSPHEAGLFAFGANLAFIAVTVTGVISQIYYPRHLRVDTGRRLQFELTFLLGLVTVGSLVVHPACRFALSLVFPHFAAAAASTAATLGSTIPLCLAVWLIPLVISRARRPILTAIVFFVPSIITLFCAMFFGNQIAHINGQGWACTPPAIMLLALELGFVVRERLLGYSGAMLLFGAVISCAGLTGAVWFVTFHEAFYG